MSPFQHSIQGRQNFTGILLFGNFFTLHGICVNGAFVEFRSLLRNPPSGGHDLHGFKSFLPILLMVDLQGCSNFRFDSVFGVLGHFPSASFFP